MRSCMTSKLTFVTPTGNMNSQNGTASETAHRYASQAPGFKLSPSHLSSKSVCQPDDLMVPSSG